MIPATPIEKHRHVVVLVHSARRLGAQDGREALARKSGLDDLREGGKDRVGQLGHDQPDESGALAAQTTWPVIAEDVERREHSLPGQGSHARLVVEDPADGGLADLRVPGDVRQS